MEVFDGKKNEKMIDNNLLLFFTNFIITHFANKLFYK